MQSALCANVRPSHGWISQKRLKLISCNFLRGIEFSFLALVLLIVSLFLYHSVYENLVDDCSTSMQTTADGRHGLWWCDRLLTVGRGRSETSWASRWRTCRLISTTWVLVWTRSRRRQPACEPSCSVPRPTTRRSRASTTRRSRHASKSSKRHGKFIVGSIIYRVWASWRAVGVVEPSCTMTAPCLSNFNNNL